MSYDARMSRIVVMLGFKPGRAAFPADGVDQSVFVDGVEFWVGPKVPGRGQHHRVMTRCPKCGDVLTAGRLPQHLDTTRCVRMTLGLSGGRKRRLWQLPKGR